MFLLVMTLSIVSNTETVAYDLSAKTFDKLLTLIRPESGESKWREIPWLTDLGEARRQAVSQGKPILIWSAGGAPPIGGC